MASALPRTEMSCCKSYGLAARGVRTGVARLQFAISALPLRQIHGWRYAALWGCTMEANQSDAAHVLITGIKGS